MRPQEIFFPPDTPGFEPLRDLLQATIDDNIERPSGEYDVVFTQATLVNSGEIALRSIVLPHEISAQIASLVRAYQAKAGTKPLVDEINRVFAVLSSDGVTFDPVVK